MRNTLFFNHFHTPQSNEYVTRHGSAEEWEGVNHFGSPVKILEGLKPGQKAVITVTDHYQTAGKQYYRELIQEVEEKGGEGKLKEKSLDLELEDSRVKAINGVEACYREENNHIILGGLPVEDESKYMFEEKEKFRKAVEKAEYAHPAHPFFGDFGIDEETLDEICRIIQNSGTKLFIPHTTAYGPKFDKKARGTEESERDIFDLREEFSAPFIVEQDHHIHIPSGMNGVGILEDSAPEKEVPVSEIEEMNVIEPRKSDSLRDLWRIGRTYADLLPGYSTRKWFWRIINTPYSRKDYRAWRNLYYRKELGDLNMEELRNRSRSLNP